jgi:hypothetical protein
MQQRFMQERFLQEQDGALHAHSHAREGEEEKGGGREKGKQLRMIRFREIEGAGGGA